MRVLILSIFVFYGSISFAQVNEVLKEIHAGTLSGSCLMEFATQYSNCTEYYNQSEILLKGSKTGCETVGTMGTAKTTWMDKPSCPKENQIARCERSSGKEIVFTYSENKSFTPKLLAMAKMQCSRKSDSFKNLTNITPDESAFNNKKMKKPVASGKRKPRSSKSFNTGDKSGACYKYVDGKPTECKELINVSDTTYTMRKGMCEAGNAKVMQKLKHQSLWVENKKCSRQDIATECKEKYSATSSLSSIIYKVGALGTRNYLKIFKKGCEKRKNTWIQHWPISEYEKARDLKFGKRGK